MGVEASFPEIKHSQTDLNLSDRNIEKIPFKIPKKCRLKNIDLSGNNIISLPKHLKHLIQLNISQNNISELNEKMEHAILSYKNLEIIDISNNKFKSIPNCIQKLPALKRILAENNKIQELPHLSSSIELVDLKQNRLKKLPNFHNGIGLICADYNLIEILDDSCDSLVRLYLNMNKLSSIKNDLVFPNLEVLEISKNFLEHLPDFKIFSPKLKKLVASNNLITKFPSLPTGILEVEIGENKIEKIEDDALSNLTHLTHLDLSQNFLSSIPALPPSIQSIHAISNLIKTASSCDTPHLKTIMLSKNHLKEYPIYSNNNVTEIYIMRNFLETLPVSCFSQKLTRLSVSDNCIKVISDEIFLLPKLTHLNISKNLIESLPNTLKKSHLVYLNLSENPIKEIPDDLPQSLVALYSSYTNISEFPKSLSELDNLNTFVSCGNHLKQIPKMEHLKKLILSRNDFEDLPDKLPATLFILDFSCNRLKKMPNDFSFPALLEADFSYNHIEDLPSNINCVRLKSLKLSHNPLKGTLSLQDFLNLDIIDISFTNLVLEETDPIREIVTSNAELFTAPQFKLVTEQKPYISFAEMCGQRDSMEDAIVVRPNLFDGTDLYCVFDGHGGSYTATLAAYQIVKIFEDPEVTKNKFSEEFVQDAFSKLIEILRKEKVNDGATLAMTLLKDDEVIFAHLGDSRAMLLSHDENSCHVKHVTADHKPDNRGEIERILEMGGKVSQSRTNGVVAVSRCLGDFGIFGVGTEPTITKIKLSMSDRWIIVACDGVFDVLSNENITEIANNSINAVNLSYDIRNIAYHRMCTDNISVVVVDIKNRPKSQ